MMLDAQSYFTIFVAGILTLQQLTEGHPEGNGVYTCGKRIHAAVKAVCKGVVNDNFGFLDLSSAAGQKAHESIVEKCCKKPCSHSDYVKYCGSPELASSSSSTNEIIRSIRSGQPSAVKQNTFVRPRRGGQRKLANVFNQRVKAKDSTGDKAKDGNSCQRKNPANPRHKRTTITSDETTEGDGMSYMRDNAIASETESTKNNPGNLVTDRPVRRSFVVDLAPGTATATRADTRT